jgi:hypothetical protein
MDESDEDIDPLVGPVADLMAEHNLSSTSINVKKPVESMVILEQKIKILDYLAFLNIHLLFKDVFNYILDHEWYHYLNKYSPKLEQEVFHNQSSLKKLSLLFIVRTSLFPIPSDLVSFIDLHNSHFITSIRNPSPTDSLHLLSSHDRFAFPNVYLL